MHGQGLASKDPLLIVNQAVYCYDVASYVKIGTHAQNDARASS